MHLSLPHFLHLKSCPEKSVFSAVPCPIFLLFIDSFCMISSFSNGFEKLHDLQMRFGGRGVRSVLHFGQNSNVIVFCGVEGFYNYLYARNMSW